MADSNKTEPGSAHKRQEAHHKGQVARARDLPGVAGMLAAIGVLAAFSGGSLLQWRRLWVQSLQAGFDAGRPLGLEPLRAACLLALQWSALVCVTAWVCAAAVACQGGFVFAPALLLRFDRFRPTQNLKNLVSAGALSRTGRSVIPLLVIGYITYAVVAGAWDRVIRAGGLPIATALAWLIRLLFRIAWRATLVLLVWAAVDYLLQRRSFETSLRMSKQEVKQENKELQGSPETRGRIRRLQRQMHRKRMMHQVALASVVITNPTEYAIALRYQPGVMAAPVVVAKGRHLLAARIRARAVAAGVPVVENRPLARALYRHVEVGAPIPGRLYAAVAEILAFLQRARASRPAMGALPAVPSVAPR